MLEAIKKNYKIILIAFLAVTFLTANLLLSVFSLYGFSGSLVIELYKFIQLILSFFLISILFKKINKILALFTIFCLCMAYLMLVQYRIITLTLLDFNFLKSGLGDLSAILSPYKTLIFILIFISIANAIFIHKVSKVKSKKTFLWLTGLAIIMIACPQILNYNILNNELIVFAETAYANDLVIDYYQNYYDNLIKNSENSKWEVLVQAEQKKTEKRPAYLDNIIFLQLESVNGLLVNEKNTPNLIELGKKGIFFPEFYGNSVMTIKGQENILCSMPSSFYLNLVQTGNDEKILCLPEIMNNLKYKTFFLKSFNLYFSQTGEFMNALNFNEVHGDDIMEPEDEYYQWGYKEDIFYKRAFDFIKDKKIKNNFIYVEVGPTNHWPFATPEEYINEVPYKDPKSHQERLANTTYIQDKHLAVAWEKINEIFPEKNYTVFILGDHGWPAGIHTNNTANNSMANIFNQRGSYEENFLTSLAIIFGGEEKYNNKTIKEKYSAMDIMPSIMDLFNIKYPEDKFSRSFACELTGEECARADQNILLIQPYSNRYINIINNSLKYQYDGLNKTLVSFDLKKDKMEENGLTISKTDSENLENIKKLFEF